MRVCACYCVCTCVCARVACVFAHTRVCVCMRQPGACALSRIVAHDSRRSNASNLTPHSLSFSRSRPMCLGLSNDISNSANSFLCHELCDSIRLLSWSACACVCVRVCVRHGVYGLLYFPRHTLSRTLGQYLYVCVCVCMCVRV